MAGSRDVAIANDTDERAPPLATKAKAGGGAREGGGASIELASAGALGPARTAASSSHFVSIVVPGLNESESLPELHRRLTEALAGTEYEILFVDDGSTDPSWKVITELSVADPHVEGIRLRRNFGKAMALLAGFERARGELVITLDADLQDDPVDLPKFINKIVDEGFDVVVGWKVERLDPANRLVLSRIFNGTVRLVTGVALHDMNCGFKAYRREVLRTLPLYGDLFRFIPAFAAAQGFRVTEVPVKHHARKFGRSRYGLERILRGFFDLLSVVFLTRYGRKPMHLFGVVGLALVVLGLGTGAYLSTLWVMGNKIGDRPLLLLAVLLIVVGIQFFSTGLVGEYMVFQAQRKVERADLPIREETPRDETPREGAREGS